jgi:hypothetical protein
VKFHHDSPEWANFADVCFGVIMYNKSSMLIPIVHMPFWDFDSFREFTKFLALAGKKIEFITAGGRVSACPLFSTRPLHLASYICSFYTDNSLCAAIAKTDWNPI